MNIVEAGALSGADIGRVVQFTTSGGGERFVPGVAPVVPVGGELCVIEHNRGVVRVALRGVAGPHPTNLSSGFELQPTDRVQLDAFEVVVSR